MGRGAEDERLAEFDGAVGAAGGGEQSELDDDEELRIDESAGSLAPNNLCPISLKPVIYPLLDPCVLSHPSCLLPCSYFPNKGMPAAGAPAPVNPSNAVTRIVVHF